MKKFKKAAVFLTALFALTLSAGVFAACEKEGEKPDKEAYYNVTVLCEEQPVSGAEVTFHNTENEENAPQSFRTGDDGVAHADIPRAEYLVTVTDGIPEGFGMAEQDGYYTANEGRNFTIELVPAVKEDTVSYTVSIVAPEGSNAAVSNRQIIYAESISGDQRIIGTTQADGTAQVNVPKTGYLFVNPPTGYNYDRDYTGNSQRQSPYKINRNGGSMTFRLLRENNLRFENAMTDEEKNTFANTIGSTVFREAALGTDSKPGRAGYEFSVTLKAGETQFFTMRAAINDNYTLFTNKPDDCTLKLLNSSYDVTNGEAFTAPKSLGVTLTCTKNANFTFSLTAGDRETTVRYVILQPEDRNETRIETTGIFNLTIQEKIPVLISFRPAESGKYQFAVMTEGNFVMHNIYSRYADSPTNPTPPSSGDDQTISYNGIFEFNIKDDTLYYKDSKGNIDKTKPTDAEWLLRIFTNDNAAYPLPIQVKIERIGDADEGRKYNFVDAEEPAAGELTQAEKPNGTPKAIGVYKSAPRIVKGADGKYRLNAENGPIVFVKLQGNIPPYYSDAVFESLDSSGVSPYRFNVTTEEDMKDPTAPYTLRDYTRLLRGYKSYDNDGNPTDKDAYNEYYLKYVNADGMYPLDDTLKEFLTLFSASASAWISGFGSYTNDSLYLFSAYYYDDGTPLPEPVPSKGDGTQANPYELEIGSFSVKVTAGTPVYLKYVEDGIVEITAAGATVSASPVTAGETVTLTATESKTYIVTVNYVPGTNKANPIAVSDGDELEEIGTDGVWYAYTAQEDGIYEIAFSSSSVNVFGEDGMSADLSGMLLKAGKTVLFRLTAEEGTASTNVNIVKSAVNAVVPDRGDGTKATPYEITQTGLYAAVYTEDTVYYTVTAKGRYILSAEDDNLRIVYNGGVYEKYVYLSIEVDESPVSFSVASLGGADTLYFTLADKLGYDEDHAIEIVMKATDTSVTGRVSIEGVYSDQQHTTVGDLVYHSFTAPKDGLYIVTFSNGNAMLNVSDPSIRYVFDYATNVYRVVLNRGEKFAFSLSSSGNTFPVSYAYTFTWNEMPAEGSKDLPEEATLGAVTLNLKKGEEHYFVIQDKTGYSVNFNAGNFIIYDLGASSFNDDRRKDEYVVQSGDTIAASDFTPRMHLVVVATEDCSVRITFA